MAVIEVEMTKGTGEPQLPGRTRGERGERGEPVCRGGGGGGDAEFLWLTGSPGGESLSPCDARSAPDDITGSWRCSKQRVGLSFKSVKTVSVKHRDRKRQVSDSFLIDESNPVQQLSQEDTRLEAGDEAASEESTMQEHNVSTDTKEREALFVLHIFLQEVSEQLHQHVRLITLISKVMNE